MYPTRTVLKQIIAFAALASSAHAAQLSIRFAGAGAGDQVATTTADTVENPSNMADGCH